MSILLADDDAQLATFLSQSLESEGYSVHTALDESSVLAELERQNYKLILLDLNFGQTDGLRLFEQPRAEGRQTPVMPPRPRPPLPTPPHPHTPPPQPPTPHPTPFQQL